MRGSRVMNRGFTAIDPDDQPQVEYKIGVAPARNGTFQFECACQTAMFDEPLPEVLTKPFAIEALASRINELIKAV